MTQVQFFQPHVFQIIAHLVVYFSSHLADSNCECVLGEGLWTSTRLLTLATVSTCTVHNYVYTLYSLLLQTTSMWTLLHLLLQCLLLTDLVLDCLFFLFVFLNIFFRNGSEVFGSHKKISCQITFDNIYRKIMKKKNPEVFK